MNTRIVLRWTGMMIGLLSGLLVWQSASWGAGKLTVTAQRVNEAPTGLDDPVWHSVQAVDVPFEGKERFADQTVSVITKAVYTQNQVYFRFSWPDATKSMVKGAWRFDGQQWQHLPGNEDRFALLFEVYRINQFATKGCAATCHGKAGTPTSEWAFATKTASEKGDLWHWKAARSAPYHYADDGWLTVANPKTGRKKDAGQGGDMKNETADKSKPRYMQSPTLSPAMADALLKEEAAEIPDTAQFKAGDVIPFRLPVRPSDSRADVKALSRYAGGHWTLMLSRQLGTGHEDDVQFNPRKKYSFAMAVFDDSGDEHSYDSEVMTLRFGR